MENKMDWIRFIVAWGLLVVIVISIYNYIYPTDATSNTYLDLYTKEKNKNIQLNKIINELKIENRVCSVNNVPDMNQSNKAIISSDGATISSVRQKRV